MEVAASWGAASAMVAHSRWGRDSAADDDVDGDESAVAALIGPPPR